MITGRLFQKRCDSEDNFESILHDPFLEKNINIFNNKTSESFESSKGAGLNIPVANASLTTKKITTNEFTGNSITPSYAAKILNDTKGVIVIDEADILRDCVKLKLAEFIKILSDNRSSFKVLIVGIASTVGELLLYHASINRCLKETKISPMSVDEIKKILKNGELKFNEKNKNKKIRIFFKDEIIEKIAILSGGYPYYAHLISLKCYEEALSKGIFDIDSDILSIALENSALDFEVSLDKSYEESLKGEDGEIAIQLLKVSSFIESDSFDCDDIMKKLNERTNIDIEFYKIYSILKDLSRSDKKIFTEISKGKFKFSDPRMPSFIKLKN